MNTLDFIKFMIEEEHKNITSIIDNIDEAKLAISLGENDTIGSRLKHICGSEFGMAGYLYSKGEESLEVDETTVDGLRKAFSISKARHLETIDNISVNDLDKMWTSPRSGREFTYKWLLYHFIEHIATHRGQVSMALRLFGN